MKWMIATLCFFLVFRALAVYAAVHAATAAQFKMSHACKSDESWILANNVSKSWAEEFNNFLAGKTSPFRGFAEALAMRRLSTSGGSTAEKIFSEYWISRALFQMKQYALAHQGFSALAKPRKDSKTGAIEGAAIQCLAEIQKLHPSLEMPKTFALDSLRNNPDAGDAILLHFLNRMASGAAPLESEAVLQALPRHSSHYWLAKGILESRRHDYAAAAESLDKFFGAKTRSGFLSRFEDAAHLLAGRANYSAARFDAAAANFHSVSKRSNDLADAMSALSWSHLMAARFEEAVGAAIHLRAGGLKNTFTPEASMVAAMALGELCQYPASLEALRSFRVRYAPAYLWLKSWSAGPRTSLYPMLVGFLKGVSGVPPQIAGEWARTPHFLARQEELNALVNFDVAASALSRAASGEQRQARSVLIAGLRDFIRRYKSAKAAKKTGERFSASILAEFERLKSGLTHYRRFAEAGGAWKRVIAKYRAKIPARRAQLAADIEAELSRRNATMLALLEEVSENNQLIETEIFNGASEDLIWKNAHPDFANVTEGLGKNDRAPAATWNWGKTRAATIDDDELWEDELGFAKADVTDNCANKDKYLKIKMRSARR